VPSGAAEATARIIRPRFSPGIGRSDVPSPPLLADEMLGRLARYLRMLGCDTVYARGATDDEIATRARAEGRRLITRDRALARRVPGAVLLDVVDLEQQLREVRRAIPDLPSDLSFDRCTLCNGRLRPVATSGSLTEGGTAPSDRAVYGCEACGHRYWEGSHTASVRRRLRSWSAGGTG
jgi:uncharacterized protein